MECGQHRYAIRLIRRLFGQAKSKHCEGLADVETIDPLERQREQPKACLDCKAGPRSSVAPPVEHDRERHSLLASVTKANLTECDRASITCSQTAGIAKGRPFENLLKPGIFVRPIEARCSPGAAELGVVLLRRNNRQRPDKIQPPSSQSNRCSKSRPNSQTARDR